MTLRQQTLQTQYAAMETMLGTLKSQSDWLTGQLASLPTYTSARASETGRQAMTTAVQLRTRYARDAVQTASPARLVTMLYDRLARDLDDAELAISTADHQAAHNALRHAQDILAELSVSLDATVWAGGAGLKRLYAWLMRELVAANVAKDASLLPAGARGRRDPAGGLARGRERAGRRLMTAGWLDHPGRPRAAPGRQARQLEEGRYDEVARLRPAGGPAAAARRPWRPGGRAAGPLAGPHRAAAASAWRPRKQLTRRRRQAFEAGPSRSTSIGGRSRSGRRLALPIGRQAPSRDEVGPLSGFSSLNVGTQALFAAQQALDVVGQNVSNVNTEGYSRQRVQQVVARRLDHPGHVVDHRPLRGRVDVTGTQRIRDYFLEARAQQEHAHVCRPDRPQRDLHRPGVDLRRAEPRTGLQSQLSTFWNSWQDAANSPGDAGAGQPRARAGQVGRRHGQRLRRPSSRRSGRPPATTSTAPSTQVNSMTAQVARLNGAIRSATLGGDSPNELADQRDPLVLQHLRGDGSGRRQGRRRGRQPHPRRAHPGQRRPQPAAAGAGPDQLPLRHREP